MLYNGSGCDPAAPDYVTVNNDKNCTQQYCGLSNQGLQLAGAYINPSIGATCYMNSMLQSLFMTPEFRKAIYKWK